MEKTVAVFKFIGSNASRKDAFKAMHATAMCCRGCMKKWWKVAQGKPLTPLQQVKVVKMLMAWIQRASEISKQVYS